jgi:hypothetical protein
MPTNKDLFLKIEQNMRETLESYILRRVLHNA